jgi:thioesterase domain-containing protein
MSDQIAQNSTAQLFGSVRAARSWVQAGAVGTDASPVPGCITMKSGNDEPPVFMFPGAAGSILQIAPLASALDVSMPVYAIKPRGMERGEAPYPHLVEMAEHARGVITEIRPQGPYLLVGYSAGGLIALEVARRLAASGQDVPLLVLLDTYPSRETWPLLCHLDILARQTIRALWTVRRLALRQAVDDVTRRLRSLLLYLTAAGLKLITPPVIVAEGSDAASRRVHLATYNAGEAHRPSRYAGKVVFLQPTFVPNLEPRSPRRVWSKFLSDLTVRRVPRSHLSIIDEGATATSAQIAHCLAIVRKW